LEYDFVVSPGGDPKVIRLALSGPQQAYLDSQGDLVLEEKGGQALFKAPLVYQVRNGRRERVDSRFILTGNRQVGFEVPSFDATQPLVIDPVLDYSTYLGLGGNDYGDAIAVDAGGNAYVAGTTSGKFPTTTGAYQPSFGGGNDAFVVKLNPSGTGLLYSTYIGGSGYDQGSGIAVDSGGNAYITGTTTGDFPTTNGAYQTSFSGSQAIFATKLNPSGNGLVYSTYIGTANTGGSGIAIDGDGDAFITGYALAGLPTTSGAYQTTFSGTEDAFVLKLNPAGTGLVYSTYLGGSGYAWGSGIALDGSGSADVLGTANAGFPTTSGAYQAGYGGGMYDCFIAKLSFSGSALLYSTYLGGSGNDEPGGIAINPAGYVFVAGSTDGNFPTTGGAYQTTYGGGTADSFVVKFNFSGNGLVYSTYLGGSGDNRACGLAIDANGNAYVTGFTDSSAFPTTSGAYQTNYGSNGSGANVYLVELNQSGSGLLYSTFLGGSGTDMSAGIALDHSGNVYLTGQTGSPNFPISSGAPQTVYVSPTDVFVSKFDASAFYTPTNTPTVTPTPTNTYTITWTGTPTFSPTLTYTPTITFTPTSTPSPSYLGPNAPGPGTSFVYPSPSTTGTVNFAFGMAEGGTAQVLVWNTSAELVADTSQTLWAGPQKITLSTQGWARGAYFYRVVLHYNSGTTDRLPPDKFLIE
jgi:hypothetical protein